jgi:hypothetical protein
MTHPTHLNIPEVIANFQVEGHFIECIPYGSGYINDTFLSRFRAGQETRRYIHQWINHHVFKEPEKVMENIERVTRYARERIAASGGDPRREALTLVPAADGRSFYRSPQGEFWRTYVFIDGARSYDQVEDPRHLTSAAKAFGNFQKLLSTLPGDRLHETIPGFHDTPRRFANFLAAVEQDAAGRAAGVQAEIDFFLERAQDTSVVVDLLRRGEIPERVTHNDTKLNNVLIDDRTGDGVCVIDLDTVMPGSALYDFGDMVRIGACRAAEDEADLARVELDIELYERLAAGYLEAARDFLTPAEIDLLPFSAKLITLEQGIRFLTDYLNGDTYYKTSRPNHNLDRCRTQIKLVAEMEQKKAVMAQIASMQTGRLSNLNP